jgi:putative endopeptidase
MGNDWCSCQHEKRNLASRMLTRVFCFASLLIVLQSVMAADVPAIDPANMDRRVKPGDDFYQYANGGWLERTPIPPEYSRWGSFQELVERNYATLHGILEESRAQVTKGDAAAGNVWQLVGQFYASGMNEEQIDSAGAAPLQPILD